MSYRIRPNEPRSMMLTSIKNELQSIEDAYQRMCKESVKGSVAALVQRNPDGSRNIPNQVRLDIEQGVVGDRWYLDPKRDIKEQIAIMNIHVARTIANGQSLTLFGDALFLDFDLSPQNTPVGTRIRIGDAIVEVTDEPHVPCLKFKKRFGNPAFTWCAKEKIKCYRGIYVKVMVPGDVFVGSPIIKMNPKSSVEL